MLKYPTTGIYSIPPLPLRLTEALPSLLVKSPLPNHINQSFFYDTGDVYEQFRPGMVGVIVAAQAKPRSHHLVHGPAENVSLRHLKALHQFRKQPLSVDEVATGRQVSTLTVASVRLLRAAAFSQDYQQMIKI